MGEHISMYSNQFLHCLHQISLPLPTPTHPIEANTSNKAGTTAEGVFCHCCKLRSGVASGLGHHIPRIAFRWLFASWIGPLHEENIIKWLVPAWTEVPSLPEDADSHTTNLQNNQMVGEREIHRGLADEIEIVER